jgi:hypothetical protein
MENNKTKKSPRKDQKRPVDLAEEKKDDSKEEHLVIIEMRSWITDIMKEHTVVIQIVP